MELTIGNETYRVVFRHVIECSIRTREKYSTLVATGEAKCRPGDEFDGWKGSIIAFKKCMAMMKSSAGWSLYSKDARRQVWREFLRKLG